MEALTYTKLGANVASKRRENFEDFCIRRQRGYPGEAEAREKVHSLFNIVKQERIRVLSADLLERDYDRELVTHLSNRISGWDVRLAEIKSENEVDAKARRA